MGPKEKPGPVEGRRKPGPKPREVPYTVTTIRLEARQWQWLRTEALRRAIASRGKADASLIVRELIDQAIGTATMPEVPILAVPKDRLGEVVRRIDRSLLRRPRKGR